MAIGSFPLHNSAVDHALFACHACEIFDTNTHSYITNIITRGKRLPSDIVTFTAGQALEADVDLSHCFQFHAEHQYNVHMKQLPIHDTEGSSLKLPFMTFLVEALLLCFCRVQHIRITMGPISHRRGDKACKYSPNSRLQQL